MTPAAGAQVKVGHERVPERTIRHDLPLTNAIRRAHAAGTRDSTGRPGPKYWQLRTDYTIEATLDPATATIVGRERVVLHNTSDSALRAIVLRLDQNVFRGNVPRASVVPELTDGMTLTRLAIDGTTVDLTADPLAWYITQTSARLDLSSPVPKGGTVALDVEWRFRVPPTTQGALRMGRWGDSLFQVAQWYPRIAVFDDLRAGGWDTEPYLGRSEFYNNFGHFDVKLTVPAGWLVGATGTLQNASDVLTPNVRDRLARVLASDSVQAIVGDGEAARATVAGPDGHVVWRFVADSVSDFAWATSDRYHWDAMRATIPERGMVPVHLLYLPGHANDYKKAAPVARHALEFYSRLWMPYAFPQLTLVDGPEGGMEYPMFVMSSIGAADHEVGHQWWPMMVGVNETWYAFMDEGFNQYMNVLSDADRDGTTPNFDGPGQEYGHTSGDERETPLMANANYAGSYYGFRAYVKAPMMLSMLGGIVGDSAVQRAMREYAKAWRFRHPSPWDFAFFMNHALGKNLDWFWYYWLFTTESVDGSIGRVSARPQHTSVTIRQDGQMPAPVVLEVKFAPQGAPIRRMPNSVMVDSVTAIVTYPVDVWFGGRRTFVAKLGFGGRRIERITLDPRRRFPDRDTTDNVWAATVPTAAR